ncbi:hypothetical protein Tco_0855934 [Tanacetum coccineum]
MLPGEVPEPLLNMIRHFKLRDGYRSMKVELESVVASHDKYQAWSSLRLSSEEEFQRDGLEGETRDLEFVWLGKNDLAEVNSGSFYLIMHGS